MEIQVGEYVRTDKGNIGKVIEKRLGKFYKNDNEDIQILKNIYELDIKQWTTDEYVKNHSFEPIDLIEVGDYVNGEKVVLITNENELLLDRNINVLDKYRCIKTIVTKEQFESMSYKVGE